MAIIQTIKKIAKKFKKFIIAALIGGTALAAGNALVSNKISPNELLKTTPDKIIRNTDKNGVVLYEYISDELEEEEKGEEISKRTENAKFFFNGKKANKEKWTVKVYSGYPFYKEELGNGNYRWLKIKTATTTTDAYKRQTEAFLWFIDDVLAVSTTTFANNNDGQITYSEAASTWAAVHDALSGNAMDVTAISNPITAYHAVNNDVIIERFYMPFDTSVLSSALTISSSTFYGYISGCTNNDDDGADFIALSNATPANVASTTFDDYDQFGTNRGSDTTLEHDLSWICLNLNNYVNFNLNATGTSWISTSTWTQLSLREGHDLINQDIDTPTQNAITIQSAQGTNKPYLVIDYTVASSGGGTKIIPPFMMQ